MDRTRLLPVFAVSVLLGLNPVCQAAEDEATVADEMVLKSAGIATDGPSLLEFFRNRNRPDLPAKQLAALVENLKANDRATREKAAVELTILGPAALPALRAVAADPDLGEAAALARRCLKTMEHSGTEITASASRLLLLRKPTGSGDALLTFLPRAENENVLGEIKEALSTVAYPNGKADPTLLKALADDNPLRRATAIEVLCANGQAEPRASLRKLLEDPVPMVRFRAAIALSQTNDVKSVSALITLLGDLQVEDAHVALEVLYSLAGEKAPKTPPGADADTRGKCRDAWKTWWDGIEDAAVLEEFRKRTLNEGDREKCLELIGKLGDDAFKVRAKATDDLRAMGVGIVPLLRQFANDDDPEVGRRVRDCLEELDKDKTATLPANLPRLVAVRKPAGAAEALIRFVPFAEDDFTRTEIQNAMNLVAYMDGKPDPVLARHLDDKSPHRRAAAAVALCQGPLGDNLAAVKKLLDDKDPYVRMQTALSLAGARHREAVPVLIALVEELPEGKAYSVDDYLTRLAGDKKPAGLPEGDAQRAKRREMWDAWWKEKGDQVTLVDRNPPLLAERFLGYTLMVQPQNQQVQELGADGKVRWTIAGLQNPTDAHMLRGERVLIVENGSQTVSERNLRGDVLWKKQVQNIWPFSAQRLSNGNTLVVGNNGIVEVDRSGKEVFTFNRQFNDIMSAGKTRMGQYVFVTRQQVITLDNAGKEVKNLNLNQTQIHSNCNDVLPNGNVLVVGSAIVGGVWTQKAMEFDTTGKVVWEAPVVQPIAVARLPNGNTVVTAQNAWPGHVTELDRKGQVVKDIALQLYASRAYRR
jgi:HEAT repeat protein